MVIARDDNVVFLSTSRGVFMVYLESLQFEKTFKSNPDDRLSTMYPYPLKSFYAAAAGNNMHFHGNCNENIVVSDGFVSQVLDYQFKFHHLNCFFGCLMKYCCCIRYYFSDQ